MMMTIMITLLVMVMVLEVMVMTTVVMLMLTMINVMTACRQELGGKIRGVVQVKPSTENENESRWRMQLSS